MAHILFIPSSVHGQLKARFPFWCCESYCYEHDHKYLIEFLLSILLGIYPDEELLGCVLIIFTFFLKDRQTVSHSSCTLYIPVSRAQWGQ